MKDIKGYSILGKEELKELKSVGYILEHDKTKAKVVVIENDDSNKVFTIGFRTPPKDDTGVPHIIEHSVLCGSKRFPVKDPFVELAKGSLNTFLNAMTYPDKTVYPIASVNSKDFRNLMHVYLDAVFYPNIYTRNQILKQEGWHYELNSIDEDITYNGVVYNEMKGVYSSPESKLSRVIQSNLLKDTTYGYESGGDPLHVPELTQDMFIEFHKKYYHPSNSYIYLYGDLDMEAELTFIDEKYLSMYNYLEVDSTIEKQEPFQEPKYVEDYYSLADSEELEDNTYLSYNAVIGDSLDRKLYLAFQIIDYALIDVPGAPIKEALINAGIGTDIFSSYDNGILQPIYSIIAKNANKEDQQKFIKVVEDTLNNIVSNGFSKRSLKAAINNFEFKYKEANFGRFPKGLMYGLQIFDSWLYDPEKPFIHIRANDTFEFLKNNIETGYFEKLIKDYLLDNNHKAYVMVMPKKGLNDQEDEAVALKLKEYKESLSKEELEKLIEDNKALKLYQETPSTKEELAMIPMIELSDIDKEARKLNNQIYDLGKIKVIGHDIFTNGISYVNLLFKLDELDEELLPYASLLADIFAYVDTKNFTYGELSNEINIETGGVSFTTSIINNDKIAYPAFAVKTKALTKNIDKAFDILGEILFTSKIDDKKRLKEIIAEIKSQEKMSIQSSGHQAAANRALAYVSKAANMKELTDGITFYRFLELLDKDFDAQYDSLVANLKTALATMLCVDNCIVSYTGEGDAKSVLESPLKKISEKLSTRDAFKKADIKPLGKLNEGYKMASQVQYVACASNFIDNGFKYNGSLKVLNIIFSYDYLWVNVRVKGGAYGCMCSFTRFGESFFTSYRDPNLMKTYDIYKNAYKYVEEFNVDDRDMLKYIIGAIAKMDSPLEPSAEGAFSFASYLMGITNEDLQSDRDQVLATTNESINALAPLIKSITDTGTICALGNETTVDNNKENFNNIEAL